MSFKAVIGALVLTLTAATSSPQTYGQDLKEDTKKLAQLEQNLEDVVSNVLETEIDLPTPVIADVGEYIITARSGRPHRYDSRVLGFTFTPEEKRTAEYILSKRKYGKSPGGKGPSYIVRTDSRFKELERLLHKKSVDEESPTEEKKDIPPFRLSNLYDHFFMTTDKREQATLDYHIQTLRARRSFDGKLLVDDAINNQADFLYGWVYVGLCHMVDRAEETSAYSSAVCHYAATHIINDMIKSFPEQTATLKKDFDDFLQRESLIQQLSSAYSDQANKGEELWEELQKREEGPKIDGPVNTAWLSFWLHHGGDAERQEEVDALVKQYGLAQVFEKRHTLTRWKVSQALKKKPKSL